MSTPAPVAEARAALARELASWRQHAGLTQAVAGHRIGYSRSAVARAEATGVCSRDFCRAAGRLYGAGEHLALAHDPVVYTFGVAAVILAHALIGVFWGAPLVAREIETGTFRLAWTQTITRARWLASKLALPGLAAMAVTEGLSLMYGWWAAPIGQAARLAPGASFPTGMGPFSLLDFDAHGIVPLGYAAFAFTLGVTTGTFIRRSVPAMAVTLAVFAAVQVAMPLGIRPHLFPPVHTNASIATQFIPEGTGRRQAGFQPAVSRRRAGLRA